MRHATPLLTTLALAGLAVGTTVPAPAAPDSHINQMAKQFQIKKAQKLQAKYLLFLPQDYKNKPAQRWPLILFLHGAGERGTDISKVATHGPPKHVATHPDFPFIVVSPQCSEGQIWSPDLLLALLDEINRKYRVDTTRIYLTGLSMGGYGTWDLGLRYPGKFAAIVPICGGGELITVLLSTGENAKALKTLAVWAFHGAKDPVVPPEESQRMVSFLQHVGVQEVKLTMYPEAGHDAWTETYANPELYDWLLKHQRGEPKK